MLMASGLLRPRLWTIGPACQTPVVHDSRFMLYRGASLRFPAPRNFSLYLWSNSKSLEHIRRPKVERNKGILYSTSERPNKAQSSRPIPPTPKKPLLKVLTQLTPHENIYTVPNILTFSRLIAAPVIGYLVLHDYHAWAVGLFAYAGITDLVDGYIARKWNLQTVVGTVIDPMADKTLMTILTVCLAIKGTLPVWLAGIILGRDVGLGIAAIYYRWISLPPPKTFLRYWDFSLPSAEVRPTTISKYNTALQLALIGATTASPLVSVDVSSAMTAMQYLVAITTIWSGASYIYTKDAVKILNQDKENRGGSA